MKYKSLPDWKVLVREFTYDENTGRLYHNRQRPGVRKRKPAGHLRSDGYVEVTLNGSKYFAHRIIWVMVNNEIPDSAQIDHKDGNRANNRLSNLRLVNQIISSQNSAVPQNNTSGHVGVCWDRHGGRWRARIKVKGKLVYLGCSHNKDIAINMRKEGEKKYGFHENHGRPLCYPK